MLDELYFAFDNIVTRTGCFKVETIGDGARALRAVGRPGLLVDGIVHVVTFHFIESCSSHLRSAIAALISCAAAPEALEKVKAVSRIAMCAAQFITTVRTYSTPMSRRRIHIQIGAHFGKVLGTVIGATLVRNAQWL